MSVFYFILFFKQRTLETRKGCDGLIKKILARSEKERVGKGRPGSESNCLQEIQMNWLAKSWLTVKLQHRVLVSSPGKKIGRDNEILTAV